eukprot:1181818-Prorocentrum_minimum.AAC.2
MQLPDRLRVRQRNLPAVDSVRQRGKVGDCPKGFVGGPPPNQIVNGAALRFPLVAGLEDRAHPKARGRSQASQRSQLLRGVVKGSSVDVKGNMLDVKGNYVDVKGDIVDVKGTIVDVEGNSVDVKGEKRREPGRGGQQGTRPRAGQLGGLASRGLRGWLGYCPPP